MVEKPTEASKHIHSFIHLFTKHSLEYLLLAKGHNTERSPKGLWGRGVEADLCAGRRGRDLPWRLPAYCNVCCFLVTHHAFEPLV